jgi:hypothetical protein
MKSMPFLDFEDDHFDEEEIDIEGGMDDGDYD